MRYRGLSLDELKGECKWVYGMPSYNIGTEDISEIQDKNDITYSIIPKTLSEETEYMDKYRRQIYAGDILAKEVNGKVQEFIVMKTTIDQEYMLIHESTSDGIRVRLSGVIVLKEILPNGEMKLFLPCVNHLGIDDCRSMKIVDTIYEREIFKHESQK